MATALLVGCYYGQRKDIEMLARAELKAVKTARAKLERNDVKGAKANLHAADLYGTSTCKAIGYTLERNKIPAPTPQVAEYVCREVDARTERYDALLQKVSGGLMEMLGYGGGGVGILASLGAVGLFIGKHKKKLSSAIAQAKGLARLYVEQCDGKVEAAGTDAEKEALKHRLSQAQERARVRGIVQEVLKENSSGTA